MELRNMSAHVLVAVVTEHLKFAAVGSENDAVRAYPMKGNRRVLEEIREILVEPFALGNVPRNLRCGDDPPASVLNWRDSQRNLDQTSILAPPYRLIVADAFSAPDPF